MKATINIWPYVSLLQQSLELPQWIIDKQLVEYVYRSQSSHYNHVLIPFERSTFLVIVVDRVSGSVFGYRILDLNQEYGLVELQT